MSHTGTVRLAYLDMKKAVKIGSSAQGGKADTRVESKKAK